jgi:hypothetical protein
MRRHNQVEELNSYHATRQPRKGKMTMKQAVAPYLARMERMRKQREEDRAKYEAGKKDRSVHWTGKKEE